MLQEAIMSLTYIILIVLVVLLVGGLFFRR